MPKKVSEKEKEELISAFLKGDTVEELSKEFNISKATITRHLKNKISDSEYKNIVKKNKNSKKNNDLDTYKFSKTKTDKNENEIITEDLSNTASSYSDGSFFEITPLNCEIDNSPQKDLSSIPISEVVFPKTVYMIVDKKIELETKYLKEYPEWQFLSQEELDRKTIKVYFDLKNAKRFCHKEQKVIKVPNTEVFKIATPSLLDKGVSRIVTEDILIAL